MSVGPGTVYLAAFAGPAPTERLNVMDWSVDPYLAAGVFACMAVTDIAYVLFTSAVMARRPIVAANWSGVWYCSPPLS